MSDWLARLTQGAARQGARMAARLLSDPKRAAQVARALGALQAAQQQASDAQRQALHAIGFAHQRDYRDLDRKLSALRRRARRLLERLDRLGAASG